jgi:hypothetical protein
MSATRRKALRLAGAGLAAILMGMAPPPASAQPRDLVVFAAASLKNALDEITAAWTREAGKKAVISYAASSALAKQIEAGAPADLFAPGRSRLDGLRGGQGPDPAGNSRGPPRQPPRPRRPEGRPRRPCGSSQGSTSPPSLGEGGSPWRMSRPFRPASTVARPWRSSGRGRGSEQGWPRPRTSGRAAARRARRGPARDRLRHGCGLRSEREDRRHFPADSHPPSCIRSR